MAERNADYQQPRDATEMFSRVDSGTALGAGLAGGGLAAEVSKVEMPRNIMDFDVMFGMVPGYYLTVSGLIAITGTIILVLSFVRGNREKHRREERDKAKR